MPTTRPRHTITETPPDRLRAESGGRLARAAVMVAACVHEAGTGVQHYDRDYDLITEHTSLSFESVWLAPAGTL